MDRKLLHLFIGIEFVRKLMKFLQMLQKNLNHSGSQWSSGSGVAVGDPGRGPLKRALSPRLCASSKFHRSSAGVGVHFLGFVACRAALRSLAREGGCDVLLSCYRVIE